MFRHHRIARYFSLVLFGLLLLSLLPGLPRETRAGPIQVDPYILEQMAAAPDGRAGLFVRFRDQANLTPAHAIPNWDLRGRFVHDALSATAEHSQARVRAWLEARGIPYHSLIIENALFITVDQGVLHELMAFSEVDAFRGNHIYKLDPLLSSSPTASPQGVTWNIALVGADQVWEELGVRGQGIVVANIDTGVEYTHEALLVNYKCGAGPHEDCWYDPVEICPNPAQPCDDVGHGTHVMGTMVGDDDPGLAHNVGMAPDAHWIACKGCESESCSDFALTSCADWLLAPNGDPANRPHVVNNSWGGAGCDTWYQPQVQAWRAAGIFPAFSAGNGGSSCNSVGSPGDLPESFASGATDVNDNVAWFSSRGNSCWGEVKPEVAAPGVDVCSSVPGNSWSCAYSGTSMASPHTAGLVALLWSASPHLLGRIEATENAITSTAVCREDLSCGGEPCHNNVYGWGRIDAYLAVLMAGFTGELQGQVTDLVGTLPLPGVQIRAQSEFVSPFEATTDAGGHYTLTLPAGAYTVSAFLYGYFPQTATEVPVLTDTTTVQDFALQARPRHTISGTVTEAGTGIPLSARLTVEDAPVPSVWSDPVSGFYSLTLVEDAYTLRAAALLHLSERVQVELDRDLTILLSLETSTCTLLVDDDGDRPDVRAYYTSTLDELGHPYKVWDIAQRGPPGIEDLLGHRIVLWWTGTGEEPLTADDEAVLQDYMDAWGNLFLSSQGYLYGGSSVGGEFQQEYLHLGSYQAESMELDPLGNSGDPVGDGLGPFLLVPPDGWGGSLRTDDVTHDGHGGASSPFRWQGSGADNSTDYDGGSFKTVFLAWPLEGLASPLGRRAVLAAVLDFFGECRPNGLLLGQVIDANTGEPLEGAAVVPVSEGIRAELTPESVTDPRGHFTFTLPAGSYELTVYQAGYLPEVISAISVPAGLVSYLEVSLRSPRLAYAPASFSWDLFWETTATATLVLSNSGTAGPLQWQIAQQVGGPKEPQLNMPNSTLRGCTLNANCESHSLLRPNQFPTARAPEQRIAGRTPADEVHRIEPPSPGLGPAEQVPVPLGQPTGWGGENPLPTRRYRSASFLAEDGTFFVSGGFDSKSLCLAENLRYDPATGVWTPMATMPTARANVQAGVVEGIAYLPGGYCDGFYYNTMEAYNIEEDAWITGLAPLPEPRSGTMVAALNGQIYACGGNPSPAERCWVYDPLSDVWEEIAPMPGPIAYGAAFEYNGYLYVVAGWGGGRCSDGFWRYDPWGDHWEVGPMLHQGRMSPAVSVYGEEVYVISGGGPQMLWSPNATVERYPLSEWPNGSWELLPELIPSPVVAPADACAADRVRVIGGVGGTSVQKLHQVLDEGLPCYRPREDTGPFWLTVEPISGSLDLGMPQTVTLEVDAGAVLDPGCFYRQLLVANNTVYGPNTIPLTLCVAPTPDLGKLQGTVLGLGYCDREPISLTTVVMIEGSGGTTWTVSSDVAGAYYRWLHAGTYTVTAGATDHQSQTAVLEVRPAQTTTHIFSLRYLTACLELGRQEITLYVPTGGQVQYALVLSDTGASALPWRVEEATLPAPFYFPQGSFGPGYGGTSAESPDPFGYTFLDSHDPGGPIYSWVELAATGTDLTVGSEQYATITLPFTFTLYGVPYTPSRTLRVGGHGTLFLDGFGGSYNDCLPTDRYEHLIAPYWDRLEYEQGHLYAETLGTAPQRILVLEWLNMPKSLTKITRTVTLEAILFEGSDDILFQYRDTTGAYTYDDLGASATVGIQGNFLTHYLEYSCNQPVLTDSLSICFEPPESVPGCGVSWEDVGWLQMTPTSGQVPADGAETVSLLLDTSGLERGIYRMAVGIVSDDARRPVVYVPLTLIVGLEPQIYLPLQLVKGGF